MNVYKANIGKQMFIYLFITISLLFMTSLTCVEYPEPNKSLAIIKIVLEWLEYW